jgi:hypothetical protein
MKATICVAAMTFVIGSAIAQQGSNPQTPQSPAGANPQTTPQSSPSQTKDMQSGKETMNASGKESGSMNEMKTKTFKGTLVDASCAGVRGASSATTSPASDAGSAAAPGTPSNPATPSTPGSETKSAANRQSTAAAANASASAGSANRSAADSAAGSCTVSSSTNQFAMKLDDGRTLALDMVGNDRVKEQLQKNKKWTEAASSGKPIKAKVSGVESGDKLVVSSIH